MAQNLEILRKSIEDLEKFVGLHLAILKRKVDTTSTLRYLGYALPGSSPNDGVWLIIRETLSSKDITHVDNIGLQFNQVWADRTSLVYDET